MMQKFRTQKLSEMFSKLAADKDAKELKKINLGKLREGGVPEDEDPREFYQRLNQEAENGPIFSSNTILSLQHIPETSLPKNRKPFVLWLANELEKGIMVNMSDIDNITDLVNSMNISDFSNFNFQRLKQLSDQWHQGFIDAQEKASVGDYQTKNVVYSFDNGFTIVFVPLEDLDAEGSIMGHCVGSYKDEVQAENKTIYSLRDPNNSPHVTISFDGDELDEVKGKQNQVPIPKYGNMVREWVKNTFESFQYAHSNDFNLTISYDEYLERISQLNESGQKKLARTLVSGTPNPEIITDILKRFGNNSIIFSEAMVNPNTPEKILKFGYHIATTEDVSDSVRNRILRKIISNKNVPVEFFDIVQETTQYDLQIADNPSAPSNIQKLIYFRHDGHDDPEEMMEGAIRATIAENTKDTDLLKYIILNDNYPESIVYAILNRKLPEEEAIETINNDPRNLIHLFSKYDGRLEDLDYIPDAFFEILLKTDSFELVNFARDVLSKRKEKTVTAQDFSSELESLMGKLTGDSLPPGRPQQDKTPEQQFQEVMQSQQGEVYQMPVKGGRTGSTDKIMRSLHESDFTKDNWIIGTFIPGKKINEKHLHGHNGIDVAVHPSLNGKVPAYPIASGKVVKTNANSPKGGKTVSIAHGGEDDRVVSYYAHLASINVAVGEEVSQNTIIGNVGNTGNASDTAPHVHLEVFVDGNNIDPLRVMGTKVGQLAKKADAIKSTLFFLKKYAKSRKDNLQEIIKRKQNEY